MYHFNEDTDKAAALIKIASHLEALQGKEESFNTMWLALGEAINDCYEKAINAAPRYCDEINQLPFAPLSLHLIIAARS